MRNARLPTGGATCVARAPPSALRSPPHRMKPIGHHRTNNNNNYTSTPTNTTVALLPAPAAPRRAAPPGCPRCPARGGDSRCQSPWPATRPRGGPWGQRLRWARSSPSAHGRPCAGAAPFEPSEPKVQLKTLAEKGRGDRGSQRRRRACFSRRPSAFSSVLCESCFLFPGH